MPHPANDKTDHHHLPWLTNDGQHAQTETGEKELRWGSFPLTTDLTNTESRCHVTHSDVATKRRMTTSSRRSLLLYILQFHGEYPPHRPPFNPPTNYHCTQDCPQQHQQCGNAKSPGTTAEGNDLARQQTCHVIQTVMTQVIVTVHISPGAQPLLPTLSSVHATSRSHVAIGDVANNNGRIATHVNDG